MRPAQSTPSVGHSMYAAGRVRAHVWRFYKIYTDMHNKVRIEMYAKTLRAKRDAATHLGIMPLYERPVNIYFMVLEYIMGRSRELACAFSVMLLR